MSGLLEEVDRSFRAVGHGEARLAVFARRHYAVAEDLPEAFVVVAEQVGGEVIAATMTLATLGVDLQLHWAVPVCAVTPV
jgi:hypothetical protein